MDRELIAYLDEHFREMSQQMEGLRQESGRLRQETSQKIDGLRVEMSGKIDGLREEMSGKIGGLREEMSGKIDGLREENHQTGVLVEGLRSDIQLLAEGMMGQAEKSMARHSELILEIEKVKVSIIPYYQDLNVRMGRLEQWADRQGRDAMELIREKFGKRLAVEE